jgi:hypothetical protein
MDELKISLKRMGWSDNLINHYVGKEYKAFSDNCSDVGIYPTSIDTNKAFVVDNERQSTSIRIAVKVK